MRKSERKTIFVGGEIYLLTRGGLISVRRLELFQKGFLIGFRWKKDKHRLWEPGFDSNPSRQTQVNNGLEPHWYNLSPSFQSLTATRTANFRSPWVLPVSEDRGCNKEPLQYGLYKKHLGCLSLSYPRQSGAEDAGQGLP